MLSEVIAYLAAQRTAGGGGPICYTSRAQSLIRVLPPGVRVNFTIAPPQNMYAAIKYDSTASGDLMPGTLWMEATQAGNTYESGEVNDDWIRDYMTYYILFTQAEPIYFSLWNMSTLNQRFLATQWAILIPTENEYLEIIKHLRDYSKIATLDIAREANRLLEAISRGESATTIQPPL